MWVICFDIYLTVTFVFEFDTLLNKFFTDASLILDLFIPIESKLLILSDSSCTILDWLSYNAASSLSYSSSDVI